MIMKQMFLLTPWCRVLLEQLTGLQLVKKLPAFHGTWRFITALTSVCHVSLSWASPIQSIYPHTTSWEIHPTNIHPSTPRSPQWLLSLRFPHQDPIHPHSSPIRATCPAHLDFITRTILVEEYKLVSSLLCNLLRYLVPPSSKYSPQHHVLKHPQLPLLPQCQRPSFTPIQNNRQNYSSIYLNL